MAISVADIKRVKGMGFLHNRGQDTFSGRIVTRNGIISAEQSKLVSEAAQKYGNGTVAFTVRLCLELPGIKYEDIPAFQEMLAEGGLATGGTGAKVRPVVACKGTTCVYGLYDTQGLADEIHERFYEGYRDVVLPHKFKIACGGCPNSCAKPDLNDLGIVGQRVPKLNQEKCRHCKVCAPEQKCPIQSFQRDDEKIWTTDECNSCGICTKNCPFGAVESYETQYRVYLGGRWGKKIRIGTPMMHFVTRDELMDIIEKALLLYKSEGKAGERFGQTVERLGLEATEAMLLSNELLERKAEILGA